MKKRQYQIGYKAFDKDLKCRGFQYEIGKSYKHTEAMKICSSGFHFCKRLESVFNYYPRDNNTRVCEVLVDEIQTEGDKSVTNKIKILREVPKEELNSGYYNSGHSNSGHSNSGNHNSGYYNSGHSNSGHSNSGNHNSGYSNSGYSNSGKHNSGYSNSGHSNSGNSNSGNYNSGHSNSGHSNSGNHNSGYFNTTNQKVRLFNKDTNLEHTDPRIQQLKNIYWKVKPILQWINSNNMTNQEKKDHPEHKTTQGFLRKTNRNDYSSWTKEDRAFIKSLPGYDDDVFKEITGISLKD